MFLEEPDVDTVTRKITASIVCLILSYLFLSHLCFADATPRSTHQAETEAEVAGFGQTATSPQSCLSKIDQLNERFYRQARESGREVDVKELNRQQAKIANHCVAAFSINSVALESLPDLAKLYFLAHRQPQADKAIARYLESSQFSEADKARILATAIDYALYSADKPELAEEYLAQLDQLNGAVVRQRVTARLRLVDYYLSAKEDSSALRHEMNIVNLSKLLPADAQQAALDETFKDIDLLASFVCSKAGAARSRAIIQQIPPELVRLAKSEIRFELMLSRYLLDGQKAPQLFPRNVINARSGEDPTGPDVGQVTVMLFAAYWCGPCHEIYPPVIDIYRRFQNSGVRVLLITQLSNVDNQGKEPDPEREVATIQRFYLEEVKVPFPVVIEGPGYERPRGEQNFDRQKLVRQASLFSFYPMMLVIDKKGRTRAILIGALPGQGGRLRAKVEELLKEPA